MLFNRFVGRSNEDLIHKLDVDRIITTSEVRNAMHAVDRGHYVPTGARAYEDAPQPLGHQATISAPHMHAHSLELLAPFLRPGCRGLDVGSGSGYLSACMARMVGPKGKIVGIDYLTPLVQMARTNVQRKDADLLEGGQLVLLQGDGWQGCPEYGPFDAIHVGAAAESVPVALQNQLRPGGRMVIPVGTVRQDFIQIDRGADGRFTKKTLMGVQYVPLVKIDHRRTPSKGSSVGDDAESAVQQRRRSGNTNRFAAEGVQRPGSATLRVAAESAQRQSSSPWQVDAGGAQRPGSGPLRVMDTTVPLHGVGLEQRCSSAPRGTFKRGSAQKLEIKSPTGSNSDGAFVVPSVEASRAISVGVGLRDERRAASSLRERHAFEPDPVAVDHRSSFTVAMKQQTPPGVVGRHRRSNSTSACMQTGAHASSEHSKP